jgi:hypothetical protein
MERIVNCDPLSEETEKLFRCIWKWLVDNQITNQEPPQVTSDPINYHLHGLIGIDERHRNGAFPLGAVMLEELLHYVTSSDKTESSADFSLDFLQWILKVIVNKLKSTNREREFQSLLIGYLWKLVESETSPSASISRD